MYLYISFKKRMVKNPFLRMKGLNLAYFLVYILESMDSLIRAMLFWKVGSC